MNFPSCSVYGPVGFNASIEWFCSFFEISSVVNSVPLFSLENLFKQYAACRKNKRNTINALRFEAQQELQLIALQEALSNRTYTPGRSVCFFVQRPKLREVFAADFRDRVVHHVLVNHLEKIWEPIFIHDSYACRKGKGVHAAVARLQTFMRQATANGTSEAFTLQLDIRNYFMTIDKPRLLAMINAKLPSTTEENKEARWLTEQLVNHDCTVAPIVKGDPALLARLPPHKTLFNAPAGKGLPIGNLNSQFFANVYLNALDQFVKHTLKCRWYVRYCDDFVLVAQTAEQLHEWKVRINIFVQTELLLTLNPNRERLRPVSDGVDFLGYIVRPSHLLVRRRVIGHLREKLEFAKRELVEQKKNSITYKFDASTLDRLQAQLASYLGHFKYAETYGLVAGIVQQHLWLLEFFRIENGQLQRRDKPPTGAHNVLAQYRHWQREFTSDQVWLQIGCFIEQLQWPPKRISSVKGTKVCVKVTKRGRIRGFPIDQLDQQIAKTLVQGKVFMLVAEIPSELPGLKVRKPLLRCVPVVPAR